MIKIRTATKADKEEILSFCSNTFSWGDYIDQVWERPTAGCRRVWQ